MNQPTGLLRDELARCRAARNPTDRFNETIVQGPSLWWRQREITRAVADPAIRRVAVKSGHMTGKSMVAGRLALGWLTMYEDSGVVVAAPTLGQVKRAIFAEVRTARKCSPWLRHLGEITKAPPELRYDEKWLMLGIGGTDPESLQGFHPSGPVLVIKDESSGQNDPDVDQALDSLKPQKRVDISNPLKNVGLFYDLCMRAVDDPTIRLITIPSTDSPDIEKVETGCGLADATWLRNMILEYGEDSQTYRVRVGAEFPNGSADRLIPVAWLEALGRAVYTPGGPLRMAMDLGLGRGGDDATLMVRNDHAMLHFEADRFTTLEDQAENAATVAGRWGIQPRHISYDSNGIGADFDLRLRNAGLIGCTPYNGSRKSANHRFNRLRTAAHFAMRRRLDPTRTNDDGSPRPLFYLHPQFLSRFRRECRELTFETLPGGEMALRDAEEVAAALGHSPDFSVTLAQSFAFP